MDPERAALKPLRSLFVSATAAAAVAAVVVVVVVVVVVTMGEPGGVGSDVFGFGEEGALGGGN
jgi:hypothetical protein